MGRDELEVFINESIRVSEAKGYYPTRFKQMRERWGTVETIKRLIISGDIQSGFQKMKDLHLLEWSI